MYVFLIHYPIRMYIGLLLMPFANLATTPAFISVAVILFLTYKISEIISKKVNRASYQ